MDENSKQENAGRQMKYDDFESELTYLKDRIMVKKIRIIFCFALKLQFFLRHLTNGFLFY